MPVIKVDYAVLESASGQIRSISGGINSKLQTLESRLARLHWEGEDRVAYEAHKAQWRSGIDGINQVLNQVGNAVNVAKENYRSTEMANTQAWS